MLSSVYCININMINSFEIAGIGSDDKLFEQSQGGFVCLF